MSDDDLADSLASLSVVDQVKAKHRKELKELEAKCAKLRHSVPKGDKKRLKEVKDEIAKLESDLKIRQDSEMKAAEADGNKKPVEEKPAVEQEPAKTEEPEPAAPADEKQHQSRAQRRREKKAAASAHQASIIAQAENSVDNMRETERSKIAAKLELLGLAIHDVAPNGDCLFGSLVHQLEMVHSIPSSIPALRLQAADTMRDNIDDYLPFMEDNTDEAGFIIYCRNIETTHEWGGQMELKALSRALNMTIRVVQAEGSDVELIPPSKSSSAPPLIITYHRHEFGLGEHYNSTEPWENVK